MKLCIIYNFAQKYREGIFKKIEDTYDCSWYFGQNDTDIKGLDLNMLNDAHTVQVSKFGPFSWLHGTMDIFKKNDNILLLGELFSLSAWIMLFLRKLFYTKKHIYLWSHGWYGREGFVKRVLKRIYFSLSDKTFLYGFYAQKVARQQGYGKDNLVVIHNSLGYDRQLELRSAMAESDVFRKHFKNNHKVLIFIGRLTKVKRLDLLIDALLKLKKQNCPFNLILVGDGEERENLEKLVKTDGLCDNVWFYGACYDEEKNAELVFNSDLCVAPGNVGLTAMHAMVYGTPVITHNNYSCQMPEFEAINDGKTGAFFEQNNSQSIATLIIKWFKVYGDKRDVIRTNCYNEIDSYWTPEYQINKIKEVIR